MHKGLGKGLGSLIPSISFKDSKDKQALVMIPLNKIKPNTFQPRTSFNEAHLQNLADSIKINGLAQPILVTPTSLPGEYELVAGERRLRACRINKMSTVPAIVRKTSEKEKFQLSLIENLQRDDLNPMEEAEAFTRIIKEFAMTQEELGAMIGMGRSKVANTLRLLQLPEYIKDAIREGNIPPGHARSLIVISNPAKQKEIAGRIIKEKLTTREVEKIVQNWKTYIAGSKRHAKKAKAHEIIEIENQLQHILGTKVHLKYHNNKGWINIAFYSLDHFESIVSTIKGKFKN